MFIIQPKFLYDEITRSLMGVVFLFLFCPVERIDASCNKEANTILIDGYFTKLFKFNYSITKKYLFIYIYRHT